MNPKQQFYETISKTVIKNFIPRGIEGYYCPSKEEALNLALSFLSPGDSISFGGSVTINEIGLMDIFKTTKDYIVYDRTKAADSNESLEIYRQTVGCDYYFMSSNAITYDGQLVNIDGTGNRVACLITGPKNVIVIAGINKLVPDLESALKRVSNLAAPPNAIRLERKTPCALTGRCHNCFSEECMCSNTVITRKANIPNRIKVLLVGEELGY